MNELWILTRIMQHLEEDRYFETVDEKLQAQEAIINCYNRAWTLKAWSDTDVATGSSSIQDWSDDARTV